jgi:hypothetical protein
MQKARGPLTQETHPRADFLPVNGPVNKVNARIRLGVCTHIAPMEGSRCRL